MTCWQAMKRLEDLGYSFHLSEGRVVGVLAGEAPPEASTLLEVVRTDRTAAAAYVQERETGAVVVDDGCSYSVLDALAIGQAVKRGEAVLLSPVVFHVEPVNVSVYWKPMQGTADAVLALHRERLLSALKGRISAIERQSLNGLSAEDIEALYDKYSLYKTILSLK